MSRYHYDKQIRERRKQAGLCGGCSTCAEKARCVKDRLLGDAAPVRKAPPKPRKPKQQPSKTCPLCKDKHRDSSKCCSRCLAKFSARRAA